MLESDVSLGADVCQLGVCCRADQVGIRGPAQNLDHDGLLGHAEGLHRLLMGGLGEVFAIDLQEETERKESEGFSWLNREEIMSVQQSQAFFSTWCCGLLD